MAIFFWKKTTDKLDQEREVDILVERVFNSLRFRYKIVPNVEIKTWKAYLVIFFVAGILAALVWNVYVDYLWG